jgi:RNA polymerase sigma-70 factor (ECF subfamily)
MAIATTELPDPSGDYARHRDAVYTTARSIVRDPALAEEITHDVFLRFWGNASGFDASRGSLPGYLKAMARGRSIDVIRSEEKRRRREDRVCHLAVVPSPSPEEAVSDNATVTGALGVLSADERAAIVLAFFGDQPYRDVAEALGLPEGTVKTRIRAGLGRMRAHLAAVPDPASA